LFPNGIISSISLVVMINLGDNLTAAAVSSSYLGDREKIRREVTQRRSGCRRVTKEWEDDIAFIKTTYDISLDFGKSLLPRGFSPA